MSIARTPENIETELSKPLAKSHVSTRQQNGMNLSYIEAHHAIREANRIFGWENWHRDTFNLTVVQCEQIETKKSNGEKVTNWRVSYTAQCRITAFDVTRIGTGFGQGIDKDLGKAHESAIKEAESDAMKRALMTFGDPFGLALYDKEQKHVQPIEQPAKPEPSDDQKVVKAWLDSLEMDAKQKKALREKMVAMKVDPTATSLIMKGQNVSNFAEAMAWLEESEAKGK